MTHQIVAERSDGSTVWFERAKSRQWEGRAPVAEFEYETLFRMGNEWVLATRNLLSGELPKSVVIKKDSELLIWADCFPADHVM